MSDKLRLSTVDIQFGPKYDPVQMQRLMQHVVELTRLNQKLIMMLRGGEDGQVLRKVEHQDLIAEWGDAGGGGGDCCIDLEPEQVAMGGPDDTTVPLSFGTGLTVVDGVLINTGVPGPAGADGTDGTDGADGAPGGIGPPGIDGEEGAEGPMGPPGNTGATGAPGATGLMGIPGLDGTDGDDGAQGPPGNTGASGAPGAAGSTGPQGPPGLDGVDGDDGDMGPPGNTGATGSTGAAGATGPAGPPGLDGVDGDDGDMGPPGNTGAAGAAGAAGAKGDMGMPGWDGVDGDEGMAIPGPTGAPGATGPQGLQGAMGMPGWDGVDGEDAWPLPGPTGPAGSGGSGGSATTIERDLGSVPVSQGRFTITDGAITAASKIIVTQAPGPYTGKGSQADEADMDRIHCVASPGTGTATVWWRSTLGLVPTYINDRVDAPLTSTRATGEDYIGREPPFAMRTIGRVKGNVKFTYQVLS